MNLVETAIRDSSRAFVEMVWPIIAEELGGGVVVPVEGVTTEAMSKKLDTISGIDAWHVFENNAGIKGIASRVQQDGKCWSTFTIRRHLTSGRETEYHKRMRAIFGDEGFLYPTTTIQAYVGKGYTYPVYGIGVIETKRLYQAVSFHDCWVEQTCYDGNKFLVVSWDELISKGYDVRVFGGPFYEDAACL
jgi:hypothetical protein